MKKKFLKGLCCAFAISITCLGASTKAYGWDGKKDGTGTHSMIVTQAVKVLENDMSKDEPEIVKQNFKILQDNMHKFQLGSTYPDFDPNAYKLFQDHFWDPDTNHNFSKDNLWYLSYSIKDTAESQVRKFTALARNEWQKGNYEKATWYFGQAMHYFGDLNTPYHAANVTAVDSIGHTKYEAFAEKRKDQYRISTTGIKTNEGFYADALKSSNFDSWSKEYCRGWAKQAKSLYYSHSTMKHTNEDWDYSASHALNNAQKGTAGCIYRFLYDVSKDLLPTESHKINGLMVVIKTANEIAAGTDDYVYFGIERKDGTVQEWTLDNPGNDFEANQEDTYILKIKKPSIKFSDINRMWIRKANFTPVSDDWKVKSIKVIADGSVQYEKQINKWIRGNQKYYIN